LYSYAGSLGVAAMAGGAKAVTHVDTQKRALGRCQDNHRLNGQRTDARDLERLDVTKMLRKAAAARRTFGGVIVDPPPPGVGGATASGAETPIGLASAIAPVVAPGGWVLCFFHHDPRAWDELEAGMAEALGRACEPLWRGRSGADFPESTPERDLRLSALLLP
jgi:23S rRNA G2069 N7-methylase RlmK/C1962 C5-methylase RlmI